MNRRAALLLALLGGCLLGSSHAALAAPTSAAASEMAKGTSKDDALDEVIINARKEKLSVLTRELEKSQDHFFEEYNKINTVREFQVHCSNEVHTETWIQQRECRPQFIDSATAEEARDYVATLTTPGAAMGTPAAIAIASKMPEFRKHVDALVNQSPQLRKLVIEYNALVKHYQDVRKLKFKGHWIVWD